MATWILGTVTSWRDAEGYGFVAPEGGGEDVFLHVTVVRGRRRPRTGDRLRIRIGAQDGRVRAVEARLAGSWPARILRFAPATLLAAAVVVVALRLTGTRPVPWPGFAYGAMSLVAFGAFGLDKRQATRGRRRIPEATLHALELAGGWPGALVAQRFFRHKTAKRAYQIVFWLIVAAHVGFWAWYLVSDGLRPIVAP